MTEIIFATGNKDKMREIREIMADCDVHIVSMKEAGIRVDIVEDGTTFEENAKIKARAVAAHTDAIVLADDSGLEIDALNKEPGVYSARYMGEDTSYDVKNKIGQLQQTHQGAAVGQEVVDDENVVLGGEELLGDDDIINFLVGEGLDLRLVVVVVQVDAHGLFGEHHRHVELAGHHSRDADAAGLDGEHLVDGLAIEQALPLLCHLAEQRNVHLMVDEAVHLEHVALTDDAVFADAVFQHFHSSSLPPNFPVTKRSIFHISIPDTPPVGKTFSAQI